jgi:hypothetical protein
MHNKRWRKVLSTEPYTKNKYTNTKNTNTKKKYINTKNKWWNEF